MPVKTPSDTCVSGRKDKRKLAKAVAKRSFRRSRSKTSKSGREAKFQAKPQ